MAVRTAKNSSSIVDCMKVNALTLAATATSAVPGLIITEYEHMKSASGDEVLASLTSDIGELLVAFPLSQSAEIRHSAEIIALTTLTDGVRESLPFEVPRILGIAGLNESRVIVSTRVSGAPFDLSLLNTSSPEIRSLAKCLAAIHAIPVHIAINQGITHFSTAEIREQAMRELNRAIKTGLVPASLTKRWVDQIDTDSVWDFQPTIIHGSMSEEQIFTSEGKISGITQWSGLRVADPAEDLAWLIPFASWENFQAAYASSLSGPSSLSLTKRASFWHEFSIVRWLLHGVDSHDNSVVEDAIWLFDQLIDQLSEKESATDSEPTMEETPSDVIELIDASLSDAKTRAAKEGQSDLTVEKKLDDFFSDDEFEDHDSFGQSDFWGDK